MSENRRELNVTIRAALRTEFGDDAEILDRAKRRARMSNDAVAATLRVRPRVASLRRGFAIITVIATLSAATAIAAPALVGMWDEDAQSPRGEVTEPGDAFSMLTARKDSVVTREKADRAEVLAIVGRSPATFADLLVSTSEVRAVAASTIGRRALFAETSNGGVCYLVTGGELGSGGCASEFNTAGLLSGGGLVGRDLVVEGLVADDVSRLEVLFRSGRTERVIIDSGVFAWSQPWVAQDPAVSLIATRSGRRVRQEVRDPRSEELVRRLQVEDPNIARYLAGAKP